MECLGNIIPKPFLKLAGKKAFNHPTVWHCIEKIIGVSRIVTNGHLKNPVKHLPKVAAGFLG